MNVLQESIAEHVFVIGLANDGGDELEAGKFGRTEAALTHDEFETVGLERADDDRLKKAELLDRVNELVERLLLEDLTGILHIPPDLSDRNLTIAGTEVIRSFSGVTDGTYTLTGPHERNVTVTLTCRGSRVGSG